MRRDQDHLSRRLEQFRRRLREARPEPGGSPDMALEKLAERLATDAGRSADLRAWRAAHLPRPEFPPELPVAGRRDEITAALLAHQVIVVAGETGSGKSTQLPKICLAAGRGVSGMIGHTQPRRIAARSLAARLTEELLPESTPGAPPMRFPVWPGTSGHHPQRGDRENPHAGPVGFKVRFSDMSRPDTFIKVMTDGILLAEIRSDRLLTAYDTIIVDEAHERSLNIDFLLGYLKNLLPRRPDLKLVITSATIDTARFAAHFGAPVIEVAGRTYPVEVRYRPGGEAPDAPSEEDEGGPDKTGNASGDAIDAILAAVDEIAAESRDGDTLVFLPGERDIREAAEALRKHHPQGTEILPLYARLSAGEQGRIFHPGPQRRIVLATNVAETSLTVPRIHYVVDVGTARISRYSARSRVQRLPVEKISRASADQRKGRCGRIANGICIRLFSEADYLARPEFTEPEVRRTNLGAVILRMLALDLGDIEDFPFVEPPDRRQIADGFALLTELGAVDEMRRITPLGRQMAAFHVDPRLARMIVAGECEGALGETLVITAALSVPDPRERPVEERAKADRSHAEFADERSDFVAILKLWTWYHEQARHLSHNKLRRLCRERYLNWLRMREWHDIQRELANQVKELGLRISPKSPQSPADYEPLHRALLAGLLSNLGEKDERREYRAARDGRFVLFPGSGLANKAPRWVMAAEVVETERRYARTCAAIEPEWAVAVGKHLLKISHTDPRWDRRRGAVVATEKATLFGLLVQPGKGVQYGAIHPAEAREVFIRAALVSGDMEEVKKRAHAFLAHNREFLAQAEERRARSRDHSHGVDPETLFAFFDARLPEGISDLRAFDHWLREAERTTPGLLCLKAEDLGPSDSLSPDLFPDALTVDGTRFPLGYRFRLGHPEDGVTVTIPLAMLGGLSPGLFDWLVPGLLRDKVGFLFRNLPKARRKHLMPWPHWAGRFVDATAPEGLLMNALGHFVRTHTGADVAPTEWDTEKLPEHLRMRFRVVDTGGREVAAGRDLAVLQTQLGGAARRDFGQIPKTAHEAAGLTSWSVPALPESVGLGDGKKPGAVTAFPALCDEGDTVALRLFATRAEADAHHRRGTVRLLALHMGKAWTQLTRMAVPQTTGMHYAALASGRANAGSNLRADLRTDVLEAAVAQVFVNAAAPPRSREDFERLAEAARPRIAPAAATALGHAAQALEARHAALTALKEVRAGSRESVADIRDHIDSLIYPGFIAATPWERLPHLARYLKAVTLRIRKMSENPARDTARMAEFLPLFTPWRERMAACRAAAREVSAEMADFRWLLEELRISLFAQEIRTAEPVSPTRLLRRWKEIAV